ncbi:MAG: tRNA adenosine(34) deaminase TadA [Gemmatimonadetes bacterium]|nr:tRNA adenosine(34) deaminase TadA [Gemmatimonadota bacterium]
MTTDHDTLRQDERWMRVALEQAAAAAALDEVPVGAAIVRAGELVSTGHNLTHTLQDPSAHAEMVAIRRAAAAVGEWRLLDCTLYVTLEPCAMCSGAIVLARIPRLVFAAHDPKAGMSGSLANLVQHPRLNHRVQLTTGVLAADAGEMLRAFFRARRRSRVNPQDTSELSSGAASDGV